MTETGGALRPTGRTMLRGSVWAAIAHLLPQAYTVLISVAIARALGANGMGRQSFIAFVSISVVTLCSSGVSDALTRGIAAALGNGSIAGARDLLRWAWPLELLAAFAGGLVVAAPALFGSRPSLAWVLAGAFTSLSVLARVPGAVLVGTHRWRDAAVVGLVSGAVAVPVLVAVLALGGGIAGVFAVEAAAAGINVLATLRLARRALPATAPVRDREARAVAKRFALISTVGAVLTLVVFRRSEFFFLAHYSSNPEIALYSIAFAASAVLAALPDRLGGVVSSSFAALFGAGDHAAIRAGYARSRRVFVLLAMILTGLAAAVGPAAISVVYGREYVGAREVLLLLLLGVPLMPLWSNGAWLMGACADARTPLLLSGFAALVNVVLAVVLIPRFDAVGAALANTGAQVAGAIAMSIAARRLGGRGRWYHGLVIRGVAVAAGTGAAGYAVSTIGGVAGLALASLTAVTVLSVLAHLLRPIEHGDAEWLADALGPAVGGRLRRAVRYASQPAAR
jgi:O-antigen/teichoic acid export membrane protein